MPEMTRYEHGVPSWVDIGTQDPSAACASTRSCSAGKARTWARRRATTRSSSKGGKQVAAISPAQDPGPPRWTTYINVDDVDEVAKKVESAGGKVIVAPMDVMTAGRMAIFIDTTGAVIAAWQPGDHLGAQLVNEPGAFIWCELSSSDVAKSKAFYSAVFGWGWGGADDYPEAQVSGRTIGGRDAPASRTCPPTCPTTGSSTSGRLTSTPMSRRRPTWAPRVIAGPADIPGTGRFAVLIDPQGAAFALFQS